MIQLKNVVKQVDESFTLGPVSFKIAPGMVTALIGPNGSGKSVFLRTLMGLSHPSEGMITRFGETDHLAHQWKNRVGYVPQTSSGYEAFTLAELAQLYQIGYDNWDEEAFQAFVARYELPLKKRLRDMSVGNQRQALSVLALSRNTELLVLDEPLAGVDMLAQGLLLEDWITYLEENPERAILFATHIPEEVKELADYIYCLRQGKEVGFYEKDQLLDSYARFWVQTAPENVRNLPGVMSVIERGPQVEVMTSAVDETEVGLTRQQLKVLMKEKLTFAEILRDLLKRGVMQSDVKN
ncbi:ABC transporter ATP-binding protein [Bacillus sp. FSL W7-1360]